MGGIPSPDLLGVVLWRGEPRLFQLRCFFLFSWATVGVVVIVWHDRLRRRGQVGQGGRGKVGGGRAQAPVHDAGVRSLILILMLRLR